MRKIIYTRSDGGVSVVNPSEGFRLAVSVKFPDGSIMKSASGPRPVDTFLRRWPVLGAVAEWAETEQQWLARVVARSVPADATDVQIVDASAIPADRSFRDAWRKSESGISVDMPAAREIHKDRLRQLRAPKLAALDVEFMRALESGDATVVAEISLKKQALRDATADPALASAKNPETLIAVIPAALRS